MLECFNQYCEYSHVIPHRVENYIDGLFHISMALGAAKKKNDSAVVAVCSNWIEILSKVKNARNWSVSPKDGWSLINGYYYKIKEQSFAGPCAYQWATGKAYCGMDMKNKAFWLRMLAPIYFWAGIDDQHTNSIMLAFLLAGKKAPKTKRTTCNPFYKYICGETAEAVTPWTLYKSVESKEIDSIVELKNRETSPWIWKQSPYRVAIKYDESVVYNNLSFYVLSAFVGEHL